MLKNDFSIKIFKIFRENPYLIICFLVNIFTIGILLLNRNNLPPQVPLFYGRPEGEEQLADQISLVIPPFTALIIVLVNTSIAKNIHDKFLKRVLLGLMVVTTILSSITVFKIISLVGNL